MKRIVITGASSGIGEATARLAVKNGNRVLLSGRREDRLKKLVDQLGENASYAVLDVCDDSNIDSFFDNLDEDFKDFDVLVNNAGLALNTAKTPDMPLEDWDTMIQTNITGLTHVAHRAVKSMKPNKNGHIVNLGSCAGHIPYPGASVYGATKAFVKQFSLNLRTDLLGTNIRVSNIEPGAVITEFSDVRFHGDTEKAKAVYEGYRALQAEDIANSIMWVIDQPEHVNIDNIEIMPTDQNIRGNHYKRQAVECSCIDKCAYSVYNVCMSNIQYTIRSVPEPVNQVLRKRAKREGKSFNQTVIEALARDAVGTADVSNLEKQKSPLEMLWGAGTLDAKFDEAIADQSRIDEKLWQ